MGGTKEEQKCAMVAWPMVCQPKHMGGLWIQNLENESEALGVKLWWRWLQNKSSLWSKV